MNNHIKNQRQFVLIFLLTIVVLLTINCGKEKVGVNYGVGLWDAETLGNHRAVVRVTERADAVKIHIPWRRRDKDTAKKAVIIVDAASGEQVENFHMLTFNREAADILFQAKTVPGTYFVYYMPYSTTGSKSYPTVTYLPFKKTADPQWLQKSQQADPASATLVELQSIDEFNSFYPMEVVATAKEVEELVNQHPQASYLLFAEDRLRPIRMRNHLPLDWIRRGVQKSFKGEATQGEYYTFQIGVFPVKNDISNIQIEYSGLTGKDKRGLPVSSFTCFNLEGVDWTGQAFKKTVSVAKNQVQALWFGLDIPANLKPGTYSGSVTVLADNLEKQTLNLEIRVSDGVITDRGDSMPWRHSRLRWLNSTIALDEDIVPPFTPLKLTKNTIHCLGRSITLNSLGLPEDISSFFSWEMTGIEAEGQGRKILQKPIALQVIQKNNQPLKWQNPSIKVGENRKGIIQWQSRADSAKLTFSCQGEMEFDGFADFKVVLTAKEDTEVKDIRLQFPLVQRVARYMMGMGRIGGLRPDNFSWKWNTKHNQDSLWLGDVNAGLQCSFRGANYARPLNTNFYLKKPLNMPPSWYNDGKGGCRFKEIADHTLLVESFSGARTIKAGDKLHFYFSLLITPFKPLDTKAQFSTRFFHAFKPLAEIKKQGANTVNVHHATDINPFINYPFLTPDKMKRYVDEAHQTEMKVKIYYTVRELTNRAYELFALGSLGTEIFSDGQGGGFSWLQEHIGSNYIKGWLVAKIKDAAIINSGVSRWHNYYLEGLNWLTKNIGIDGLYIDDVAFDRTVMKRVRKILDRNRTGALIDLHSANQFNVRDGFANSANLYLEHFPYINRLWFGEYFDYSRAPDFWLVEVSGIPFGLMGEMLQDGGNPWRGMVFGMTSRLPWAGDPRPVWQVWNDFGIVDSQMVGYWVPDRPVKTNHKKLLATVYQKKGKSLIAIASWAKQTINCRLSVNWKKLGLDPAKVTITAPEIKDFQKKASFKPSAPIPIEAGKGLLLIVSEK